MVWHTILVMGIPSVTAGVYAGIILLFLVSALYIGFRFDPLPAEEIQAMVDEVSDDD